MRTKRPRTSCRTPLASWAMTACLALAQLFLTAPAATAQQVSDGKIYAVYEVDFNGIGLGKFRFRSDVSEKKYSMNGNSKFTFLNGLLFKWKGSVHSSGSLTQKGPSPATFSYLSNTNGKVETINVEFKQNAVSGVVRNPPKELSKLAIPLTKKHLSSVVDPMSALMILTEPKGMKRAGKSVCDRKMPIFDGQQRFNLTLSFKRREKVDIFKNNGESGTAYVCRVKYKALAGHKPNKSGTKYMEKSDDIEVWLAPVIAAKMYVPYKIVLPTIAGYATATAREFQIDQPGNGRIAFNDK